MPDFDFEIRYRKGALNFVAYALSHIVEINALSFVEFNNDLFDLIRGKQNYLESSGREVKQVLTSIMEAHLPRRTFTMLRKGYCTAIVRFAYHT